MAQQTPGELKESTNCGFIWKLALGYLAQAVQVWHYTSSSNWRMR
jgi:hypothetical protein